MVKDHTDEWWNLLRKDYPLHCIDRGNCTLFQNTIPTLTLFLNLTLIFPLKFKIGGVQTDILPTKRIKDE